MPYEDKWDDAPGIDKPLPCPFCGGQTWAKIDKHEDLLAKPFLVSEHAADCLLYQKVFLNDFTESVEVVKGWNTRIDLNGFESK